MNISKTHTLKTGTQKFRSPIAIACLIFFTLVSPTLSASKASSNTTKVNSNADTSECEKQMQRVLSTRLDCTIKLKPESLKEVVTFTSGAIEEMRCDIPLRAKKSDIYNHWIKDSIVAMPSLPVHCNIRGAQDNTFTATANIRPSCEKKAQEWFCQINMSNVQGLGFLGKALETYVNTNQTLISTMNKHMNDLSKL
ncbi:hypothetical protein TDB9533_03075 [Thalassocella blandensis]|nr:hypothetical protein TDB9533_03075 [Thalassocella blandensis]